MTVGWEVWELCVFVSQASSYGFLGSAWIMTKNFKCCNSIERVSVIKKEIMNHIFQPEKRDISYVVLDFVSNFTTSVVTFAIINEGKFNLQPRADKGGKKAVKIISWILFLFHYWNFPRKFGVKLSGNKVVRVEKFEIPGLFEKWFM